MEVAKSITKIRKEKGYSQTYIAKELQTTQQQYCKYENGKQEIPVRHIVTLCKLYNVSANKLIGIETYMSENETKNKFIKLFEETISLINWTLYQEHITNDAAEILSSNLEQIKIDIENE